MKLEPKRKQWGVESKVDKHSRGQKGTGKTHRTAEESTCSTTEPVHETPINNNTPNFTKHDRFLYRKREGR